MEKCAKCQNKSKKIDKITPIVVGLYVFITSLYGTVEILKKVAHLLN
jgi:hypothetical protein